MDLENPPLPYELFRDFIVKEDMDIIYVPVLFDGDLARQALAYYNREPKRGEPGTNRKASQRRVELYRDDMLAGEWVDLSPQPIMFSVPNAKGKWEQVDGQQRLKALVEASKTNPDIQIVFWVCLNVPLETKPILDLVKPRTGANFLQMEGEVNAGALSSAARLLHCYLHVDYVSGESWRRTRWSNKLQGDVLAAYPGLRQGIVEGQRVKSLMKTHIAAVSWLLICMEYDPFVAAEFMGGLEVGANLDVNDARLRYRNFLLRAASMRRPWEGFELFALTIKAFNAWMLKHPDFKPSFRRNETFPQLLSKSRYEEIKSTMLDLDGV